jgi:diguanylate cyclase (GGDEF)-like protein/PAS domain S-box-containing protein
VHGCETHADNPVFAAMVAQSHSHPNPEPVPDSGAPPAAAPRLTLAPTPATAPPRLESEYTRLAESRDALAALTEQYSYMLDAAPVAYITTDARRIVVHANQRALELLDLPARELIGMAAVGLADRRYRFGLTNHLQQVDRVGESEMELDLRTGVGGRLPALLRSIPISLGPDEAPAVQSAIINISALKQAEARLRRARDELEVLANHDTLTGLPNRSLFLDRLEAARRGSADAQARSALLFIDMDRFKVTNDSLGHDIGDALLQHVAHSLASAVRSNDTVARMGGDEFTVILRDVGTLENATRIGRKILSIIHQPVNLSGHGFRPSCSIGLCMFGGGDNTESDLLRAADKAMYIAKQQGGNSLHVHDPRQADDGRSTVERELQFALERDQLHLCFQPQYCSQGTLAGHEALLRWEHPTLGNVAPGRFIPLAEQSSLISELGAWVLQEACRANMAHARSTGRLTRIAVNASPRELSSTAYADTVARVLRETGHPPESLELEITEHSMGMAVGQLEATLEAITNLGVSIALDDFGTGYSSFTRLRQLPFTRMKVDRTFTQALADSENERRIVAAMVSLGKELGLEVIAEGVETEYQLNHLREMGCQLFQGYVFSRPTRTLASI